MRGRPAGARWSMADSLRQVVDPYGLANFGMTRVDETRW
ncbi:hypothetical protein FHY29_004000 [Xanthomonas arboricola]